MFKKDLYKYTTNGKNIVFSPFKPNVEYELTYRLISNSEDYLLTKDYRSFSNCIDINENELELWHEVHKDELTLPVPTIMELETRVSRLEEINKELLIPQQ